MNHDIDFDSYRIFRSNTEKIDTQVAPIIIINGQATTAYDDTDLEADTVYYYQIFVFDKDGLSSGSNIVNGKTFPQ